MYFNPGLICNIKLTEARKQELECVMADAQVHLKRVAKKNRISVRQLRTNWRTGQFDFESEWQARESIQNLERIEHEIIAGYICIANDLCKAFYYAHVNCSVGVSMDDFVQEAAYAIFNSIYSYDGSNKFSTYCYYAIKNQLIDFIRSDRSVKISRNVIIWRLNIIRLMNNDLISFDEALDLYQSQRLEKNLRLLNEKEIDQIRKVQNTLKVDFENYDRLGHKSLYVVDEHNDNKDELDQLMKIAIDSEVLNDSELEMIQLFLADEKGWQTKFAKKLGITRMAVTYRWQKTQSKLRQALKKAA